MNMKLLESKQFVLHVFSKHLLLLQNIGNIRMKIENLFR